MGLRRGQEHILLNNLVNYLFTADDSGFPSVSILHRISTEGHVSRTNRAGHKILCKEMTKDERITNIAFNTLSDREQMVVVVKYMPYTVGERKAQDKHRARFMGLSLREFWRDYYRASRKVKKRLT